MMVQRSRRGYVLLLVMWSIVVIGAAASAALMVARSATLGASNRMGLVRARWLAEGCASEVRAALEELLTDAPNASARWDSLDAFDLRLPHSCEMQLRPLGVRVNLAATTQEQILRVLLAWGLDEARADSLAAAIQDWRDADDDVRRTGAEADWYRAHRRPVPRNAPFRSLEELLLVRGMEDAPSIDTLFTVESDPIALSRATGPVLAALPGLDEEVITVLLAARAEGSVPGILDLASRVSPRARSQMIAHHSRLLGATTTSVQHWSLRVGARAPDGPVRSTLELRLAHDRDRVAIVGQRWWP